MNGFIFELKTSNFNREYYFIESNNKRKTNKIAAQFTEYFAKKLKGTFIPLNVWANTCNKIYKEMYAAEVIDKVEQLKCYNIHTKYSGESVPKEVVTIINVEEVI